MIFPDTKEIPENSKFFTLFQRIDLARHRIGHDSVVRWRNANGWSLTYDESKVEVCVRESRRNETTTHGYLRRLRGQIRWQSAWANISHCQAARMLHITRERRELTRGTTDGDDALAPRPIRTFTSIRQRDIRDTFNGARDAIFIQSRRVKGGGGQGEGQDE